jgi:hypothetical protein
MSAALREVSQPAVAGIANTGADGVQLRKAVERCGRPWGPSFTEGIVNVCWKMAFLLVGKTCVSFE